MNQTSHQGLYFYNFLSVIILYRCKKFGKLVYSTLNFIVDDLPGLPIGSKWDMEKDIELQSTINSMYQLFEELCQRSVIL